MILLTGGTGFLGSHIAARLIGQGNEVILVARSKKGVPAEKRVDRLLDWHGVKPGRKEKVRVIEGRIERSDLGLAPDAAALLQEVDEIVHCASNTSFAERKRAEVETANVTGLSHILDLAEQNGCARFHLVSTAYVAGVQAGPCPEELSHPSVFTNVYEETKCRAERLAWERCSKSGIRLSIYRPSIVFGHSRTGRSLLFNALYYPVRTVLFLKNLCETDIRERGGRRAAELAVHLDGDGWMVMSIRIGVEEASGVNLIPVDFFVDAFAAIREDDGGNGIFHVTNERLTRIEDIIEWAQVLFRIRGIEARPAEELAERPRNPLEMVFASYLEAYGPYMKDRRIFETKRAGPILERRGIRCPDFDYEMFARCMTFAAECGWGARLFLE
ncbi:MAG: SDR family oxidoreductase [Candidatus Aminicenantales bacterium]